MRSFKLKVDPAIKLPDLIFIAINGELNEINIYNDSELTETVIDELHKKILEVIGTKTIEPEIANQVSYVFGSEEFTFEIPKVSIQTLQNMVSSLEDRLASDVFERVLLGSEPVLKLEIDPETSYIVVGDVIWCKTSSNSIYKKDKEKTIQKFLLQHKRL